MIYNSSKKDAVTISYLKHYLLYVKSCVFPSSIIHSFDFSPFPNFGSGIAVYIVILPHEKATAVKVKSLGPESQTPSAHHFPQKRVAPPAASPRFGARSGDA
jgi:hypothetical protein